jgi:hypothetical protein
MTTCLYDLSKETGYSKFTALNVTAGLYLFALPEKNINGYYEGNICAELTFAPCPVSRCDSIIDVHNLAVPALRMSSPFATAFIRQPSIGSRGFPSGVSLWRLWFDPTLFHVVFVVNKMALWQVFLRVLWLSIVSAIHCSKVTLR